MIPCREVVSLEMSGDFDEECSLPLAERLADPGAVLPDEGLLSREDQRTVLRCLARLSKSHAIVLVLHYLRNVPLRDVARLLEVTPARISQLHRQALGSASKQAWERTQDLPESATATM